MSNPRPPLRSQSQPSDNKLQKRTSIASPSASTTSTSIPPHLVRSRSTVHLPLYRRVLFPHDDPTSEIPQIIRGKGDEVELINERLNHLLAIALRGYVLQWYTRFSTDRSFPPSIHQQIIYPILHPILSDLYTDRGKDRLCELLLVDLPVILNLHIKTYYQAKSAQKYLPTHAGLDDKGEHEIVEGYHNRLPLLSISKREDTQEYGISSIYLSALSTSLINLYVTPEGKQIPDVERLMIREILAKSILGSIVKRLCEGWFWYQIVLKLLCEPTNNNDTANKHPDLEECKEKEGRSVDQTILHFFNTFINICIKLWNLSINIIALHSAAPKEKGTYQRCYEPTLLLLREIVGVDGHEGMERKRWSKRLVWGGAELVVGLFGGILDRLLPHLMKTYILNPRTSLRLIDIIEKLLFPDGYPGPSPIDPTSQEALDLRLRAERRIDQLLPSYIQRIFFDTSRGTKVILDPIEDRSCNAHLVGMVLDGLVGTSIPDLVIQEQEQRVAQVDLDQLDESD
ncbi:hypothetical protein I204_01886 [Kwoniella mangroviensis CBS 8886]|uniref:uncharacterized protein n=1 Tax=Kwoniella mangroviensis CBS 8507 TaxID=1296122 RepID=UPI00080D2D1C|nr:uncharacterized protein I203_03807 [Kwoniella mangroviensis CBS 8507]OCF67122.1 hypothetical protein I203_03807 [Kwoniella mangroviensis CBS 8507]OCF77883.1 hypothetical protein I204_01886 [Kwoniella mangroviensis CBS 8886]